MIDLSIYPDRLLTRREAAEHLRSLGYPVAAATLAKLAVVGGGPPYVSFGRRPLYSPAGLETWAQGRTTKRTLTGADSPRWSGGTPK
jgi:hypothetical protein